MKDRHIQVIGVSGVILVVFFLLYAVFDNPSASWQIKFVTIILPLFAFIINLMRDYGDYLAFFPKGKVVITASGLVGTLVGTPKALFGGMESRFVAFPMEKVPEDIRKQRAGGLHLLLDTFAATITIEIKDRSSKWTDFPDYDLENEDGTCFYAGRLDGGDIKNPDILFGWAEVERLHTQISYLTTVHNKLENQVATLANTQLHDIKQMSQFLGDVANDVKRVIIQAKSGNSADASVAAAQEGG